MSISCNRTISGLVHFMMFLATIFGTALLHQKSGVFDAWTPETGAVLLIGMALGVMHFLGLPVAAAIEQCLQVRCPNCRKAAMRSRPRRWYEGTRYRCGACGCGVYGRAGRRAADVLVTLVGGVEVVQQNKAATPTHSIADMDKNGHRGLQEEERQFQVVTAPCRDLWLSHLASLFVEGVRYDKPWIREARGTDRCGDGVAGCCWQR
jgi:hypothetical protein